MTRLTSVLPFQMGKLWRRNSVKSNRSFVSDSSMFNFNDVAKVFAFVDVFVNLSHVSLHQFDKILAADLYEDLQ